MARKRLTETRLPLEVEMLAKRIGANIRLARQRRRVPISRLAEQARITAPTIARIERGEPGVGIGYYLTVLWVLGLEDSVSDLAAPERDRVGLALDAARAPVRMRQSRTIDDDF